MVSILRSYSCNVLLFSLLFLLSFHSLTAYSVKFDVGEDDGWAVPSSKNGGQVYNQWASKNRFQVGDNVQFKYKKDSVLVVTEEEYEKCDSTHPLFFSNNGDTVFQLDRPGLFYFISGMTGHCDKGQKMIIKVLEPQTPPPPAPNTTTSPPPSLTTAATPSIAGFSSNTIFMLLLGFLFLQAY